LNAYTEIGNKQGIAATKDNIGGLYLDQKDYVNA